MCNSEAGNARWLERYRVMEASVKGHIASLGCIHTCVYTYTHVYMCICIFEMFVMIIMH